MIKKYEMARIVCLDGYVEVILHECDDHILDVEFISTGQKVRICHKDKNGNKYFKFLNDEISEESK